MFRLSLVEVRGALRAALADLTPRRIAVIVLVGVPAAVATWWWSTRIIEGRPPVLRGPDTTLSAGCDRPLTQTGTFRRTTTDGRGRTRSYLLKVPETLAAGEPMSLMLGFHGRGGKGEDAMGYGVEEAGKAAGTTIFIAPDGIRYPRYGVGWDDTCEGYDMPFFDNIIADMSENYCIDTSKISAYGVSWGGDFTLALTCCRGDRLQAASIHAASDEFGDKSDPTTYWNWKNGSCPTKSSAAIRFTHAETEDPAYPAPLFDTTSRLLRSINSCKSTSRPTSNKACVRYEGCATPLEECQYPGLGHTINPEYGKETWEFLSKAGETP